MVRSLLTLCTSTRSAYATERNVIVGKLLRNLHRGRFNLKKGKIFPVYCLTMNEYNRLHMSFNFEPGYNLFEDLYRSKEYASP